MKLKRSKSTLRPLDILEAGSVQGDCKPPCHAEHLDKLDAGIVEAYNKIYQNNNENDILIAPYCYSSTTNTH